MANRWELYKQLHFIQRIYYDHFDTILSKLQKECRRKFGEGLQDICEGDKKHEHKLEGEHF